MKNKILLFLLFSISCTTFSMQKPKEFALKQISNRFTKFTYLYVEYDWRASLDEIFRYQLHKSKEGLYSLNFYYVGRDWKFLETLYFENGTKLEPISRETQVLKNGSVAESLIYMFSEDLLKSLADFLEEEKKSTLEFKVYGKRDEHEGVFFKNFIQAILKAKFKDQDYEISIPFEAGVEND